MLAVICAAFLFAPLVYLKYFGLDAWAIHFRPYFAVGFFVFSFLFVGKIGQPFFRGWQHRRKVLRYLMELSADEVMVLLRYSESGKRTQYFDPASGAVNNLARNGVLYTPSTIYRMSKGCPYTLTKAAAPLVLDRKQFQKIILDTPEAKERLKNSN